MKKYIIEFRDGYSTSFETEGDVIKGWQSELTKFAVIEDSKGRKFAFCWSDVLRITQE